MNPTHVLFAQVQEVVLVELKDAHVQHAANTQIILDQIAPSALLTVLAAESKAPVRQS